MVVPLIPIGQVSAADAVFTDTDDFDTYFHIWAINGTVNSAAPTLVWNTTAEYFDFNVTITPNAGNSSIIEISIPDDYMGMDVFEGATLKTGTANYTLSVPYLWNDTNVPALDWKALTAANGTGNGGTYKRVQLVSNQTQATALTCRVYYATAPAVGFDGVNDYVAVADDASLSPVTTGYLQLDFMLRSFTDANNYLMGKGVYLQQEYRLRHVSTQALEFYSYNLTGNFYLTSMSAPNAFKAFEINRVRAMLDVHNLATPVMNFTITGAAFYTDTTNATETMGDGTSDFFIGKYSNLGYGKMVFYNISMYSDGNFLAPTTPVLIMNASSFSGGASTTVTDYSGEGNDGVAYGNCQYKVYSGTGFQFTLCDTAAPTYSGIATNATLVGTPCKFWLVLADNLRLDKAIFSTNNTGVWVNETAQDISGVAYYPNATITLSTNQTPCYVGFEWFFNDTVGNSNSTGVHVVATTSNDINATVTITTLYTGYHAGDTVTFVMKLGANGTPITSKNLTLFLNSTFITNETTDALGICSYDLTYPGGQTAAVASFNDSFWQAANLRWVLPANSSTLIITSGVTNMEGTYIGVYVAFLAVAFACFALSFKDWDTILPKLLFPITSAVLWSILSIISFSVYTDTLTSWNLWAIAPLCVIFAFAGVLVTTLRVFDSLRQASDIKIDEE